MKLDYNRNKNDFVFITFLFLCTSVFFWKILLHPDQMINPNPFNSDTTYQYYPWRFFAEGMLKDGQLPLWIPYTFSGEPFIANIQTAVFYPLNIILFSVFPAYLGFGYGYLVHIFLAGLFMYLLARYIKLDGSSSFLSSIIFMFSAFFVAHTSGGHYTIIAAACWIPLIFLLFVIALNKKSSFYGLITGVFIGVQFLAGHMQISLYTLFALGLYLLFRFLFIIRENRDYKRVSKLFSISAFALVVGILLSAIQLVPSLELSKYATRAGGVSYDFATSYSLPPLNFITFVLPNFFGNPAINTYWGPRNYGELSAYIGILPLIFVFIAIYFKRDDKYVLFFTVLTFLSLLFALGRYTPVYWFLWKFVPGFDLFRCPCRFIFLFTFSASILSGFGFSFLKGNLTLSAREKIWKIIKILAVLTLLLLCVTVAAYTGSNQIIQFGQNMAEQMYYTLDHPPAYPLDYYIQKVNLIYSTIMGDLPTLLVLAVGSIFILALQIKKQIPVKYFSIIVILFILSNLWFYPGFVIDTKKPEEIYSKPDYVVFLKDNSEGYRVYDVDNKIPDNFQIIYGIQEVNGFNPLKLRDYDQVLSCIHNLSDNKNHPVLNLLNVKYILASTQLNNSGLKLVFNKKNTYIYENEKVLPKAFIIHNIKIESEKEIIKELKSESFNPIDAVILEQKTNSEALGNEGFEEVKIKEYSPNEIILEANITRPGFLVLSEIYYPNWKVYVDGKQRVVYKAYHTLRSVYLDKGQHTVMFVCDPPSLRIGSWITLFTSIFLIVIVSTKIIIHLRLLRLKQRNNRAKI